ncbi:MAG: HAMP domain-containing sensor histidine kinase [Pseudomonadota bacterium]
MAPAASDLKLVVTNEEGDFLRHPDPAKRFGFEFGKRYRIQDDLGLSKEWRLLVAEAPVSKVLPEQKVGVVFDRISLDDGNGQAGGKQLVVAAIASVSELDTQAGQFRGRILLGALVIGLGLALALGLATQSLTKPIARLTESAARIAAGEPNVSLAYERNDEIGSLSRTLARMLDSLREAARSEEMASMGRMASMVAHDLRNALSSVKMNVQILSRRHIDGTDPDAAHLRISLDQIQYMESILADMLSFARGDVLRVAPLDIGEVLAAAVLSEITSIEEKRITLAREPVSGHPMVNGDRVKLVQVFQNLIENAVQACPDGGRITITSRITAPDRFEVSIADSGEGIAADIRDKVFEPFFTTRSKGTGLGLAIVRRVVKEHGGSVDLALAPDGGTVATVCLPLAPASAIAAESPALPAG